MGEVMKNHRLHHTEGSGMSEQNHMVNEHGELNENNIEDTVSRISEDKAADILSSFEEFRGYLAERIELGKKIGLNEEQLAATAKKIAEYLAQNVDPQNREEKLLKELWKAGNEEEKEKLSHLLLKFADGAA
jgi:chorismate mutase